MTQKNKIVAKATKTPVAKAARPSADQIFAARIEKVKSTGNPSLDTALKRIVTAIRGGAKMEAVEGGFAGLVGKVKVAATREVKGKAPRFTLYIGEAGHGMPIGGGFASIAYHLSAKQHRVPKARQAAVVDQAKVDALCKDLGL